MNIPDAKKSAAAPTSAASQPPDLQRRNFLRALQAVGVVGAGAAVLTGGAGSNAAVSVKGETVTGQEGDVGYHMTEHIRRYYACARYF